ncbi:hypothetical protein GUJ93_ZPchr0013g35557 [Zizania palustris]|uniref:Uncharacterized protein n=1 Tax=Zizania palustris TaxID=103762 RepID=A0A8J5X6C4_ZIZPA|nr:hypothetical protein GUJ93_ZPchr0013g35557 [Zizania palustris]
MWPLGPARWRARDHVGRAGCGRAAAVLGGGRVGVPHAQSPARVVRSALEPRPRAVPPRSRVPEGIRRPHAAGHGAAVLVPCYDLASAGPFLFSRADAVETPAYDFRLRDVCAATCAGSDGSASAVVVRSCDGTTRIAAGGGLALSNPTAAAITHVLNNKREFPLAAGVGPAGHLHRQRRVRAASRRRQRIDVDQAVAMAFGHNRTTNYIRIQAMGSPRASRGAAKCIGGGGNGAGSSVAEEMLSQKNVESVFRGKKLAEQTNADKLEWFAHELAKERDRRRTSALAPAVVKQQPSEAAAGHLPPTSYSNLVNQMFTSIL